MKDLVITKASMRRELVVFLVCVAVAIVLNVYAIIRFDTSFVELFTQFHVTLALGLAIYFVSGLIRLIIAAVRRGFGGKSAAT